MAKFDAVFFDSGGTIYLPYGKIRGRLDHRPRKVHKLRGFRVHSSLKGLGYDFDSEHIERVLGECENEFSNHHSPSDSCVKLIQNVFNHLDLPDQKEEIVQVIDAYLGPRYRSWLAPGVNQVLKELSEREIYVGLIANTHWPGWAMDRALHGVGLLRYFRTRVYSCDVGILKPDEKIFRLAEDLSDMRGRRILYVGDQLEYDIRGAKNAGWSSALIRSMHQSSEGQADFEMDSLLELPKWVL